MARYAMRGDELTAAVERAREVGERPRQALQERALRLRESARLQAMESQERESRQLGLAQS